MLHLLQFYSLVSHRYTFKVKFYVDFIYRCNSTFGMIKILFSCLPVNVISLSGIGIGLEYSHSILPQGTENSVEKDINIRSRKIDGLDLPNEKTKK